MVFCSGMAFFGKKQIAQFMLVMLLGAQLALAQHAAVHFATEGHIGIHTEQGSDGKSNPGPNKPQSDKLCQICLLAKSFSHIVLNSPALVPQTVFEFSFIFPPAQEVRVQAIASAYQPRAPPAFLI